MSLNLKKVFSSLSLNDVSESVDSYIVERIESNSSLRVGVSSAGEPVILISTEPCSTGESFPDQCLAGVQAKFFNSCSVQNEAGIVDEGIFHIIACTEESSELVDFFFDFFEVFLSRFDFRDPYVLREEIAKLSSLFSLRKKPGRQSMMGLWSELLVLSIAEDIHEWATAWHDHPRSTFDFRFEETGLDVKSFSGDNREHFFKITQLRNLGVKNCFIISMCLKDAEDGLSALDLLNRIESRLTNNKLIDKIRKQVFESAGKMISELPLFSEEIACESMLALDAAEIPCLDPDSIPLGVSEVKFKADCSNIDGQEFASLNIG